MNHLGGGLLQSFLSYVAFAFCCIIPQSLDASTIGLFYNPSFVDIIEGNLFAEASNLQASLEYLGHDVVELQSLSDLESLDIDLVIIPELEKLSLLVDQTWSQIPELQSYIEKGGGVILMGVVATEESNNSNAIDLLNRLLRSNIKAGKPVLSGTCIKNDDLNLAHFENSPNEINNNNALVYLNSGLNNGANIIYHSSSNDSEAAVAQFPLGKGSLVYFGWGWWNAFPVGNQDGGWLDLLDSTIEFLTCSAPTVSLEDKYVFSLDDQSYFGLSTDQFSSVVVACSNVRLELSKKDFGCGDVGRAQTVTLKVTDGLDRSIEVEIEIEITDPQGLCEVGPLSSFIAGQVQSPGGTPLGGVVIDLHAETSVQLVSDNQGLINIKASDLGEYTALFSNESTNALGLSTNDLRILTAHLLGVQLFTSPYQYIAADMNGDGILNVVDQVIMVRIILHTLEPDQSLAPNWQFIAKDFKFQRNVNPLSQNWDMLQGSLIDLEQDEIDVIALKLGDLDFSVK